MIRLFFEIEAAKKTHGDAQVDRAAVIGAGVMGAGIAHSLAKSGLPCILSDIDPDSVARGLKHIHELGGETDRILPTSSDLPMGRVDLVIEAAVENIDVKQRIFEDRIGLDHVDYLSSEAGLPVYAKHEYEMISVYNNTTDQDQDSMAVMYMYLRDRDFDSQHARGLVGRAGSG